MIRLVLELFLHQSISLWIYIGPLQGNYSEVLPVLARAKRKVATVMLLVLKLL